MLYKSLSCSCGSLLYFFFFFFKQKTAYEIRPRDWSSDVCSSDLSYWFSHHSMYKQLRISSPFGWRNDPFRGTYRRHSGIDLPGFRGARVMATAPGIVAVAGWVRGYGNLVENKHGNGIRTRY